MSAHLHDFRVATVSAAHILIGGPLEVALAVANFCSDHPWHPLEPQLWSPEAAASKSCSLQAVGLHTEDMPAVAHPVQAAQVGSSSI